MLFLFLNSIYFSFKFINVQFKKYKKNKLIGNDHNHKFLCNKGRDGYI